MIKKISRTKILAVVLATILLIPLMFMMTACGKSNAFNSNDFLTAYTSSLASIGRGNDELDTLKQNEPKQKAFDKKTLEAIDVAIKNPMMTNTTIADRNVLKEDIFSLVITPMAVPLMSNHFVRDEKNLNNKLIKTSTLDEGTTVCTYTKIEKKAKHFYVYNFVEAGSLTTYADFYFNNANDFYIKCLFMENTTEYLFYIDSNSVVFYTTFTGTEEVLGEGTGNLYKVAYGIDATLAQTIKESTLKEFDKAKKKVNDIKTEKPYKEIVVDETKDAEIEEFSTLFPEVFGKK